jgi:hypothetical protein
MKFRAIREFQGAKLRENEEGLLEWYHKQIYRARTIITDFNRDEVERQMSLGRHKVTNKPMSGLLNHCKPHDKEAIELTKDFYSEDEKKAQDADEKAIGGNAKEHWKKLVEKINKSDSPEMLGQLLTPGESRPSVIRAFNARSEELAEIEKEKAAALV